MPRALVDDKEFLRLWSEIKSPAKLARHLHTTERAIYSRRRRIEDRKGFTLHSVKTRNRDIEKFNFRNIIRKVSGPVLCFGDLHCWPGDSTPAYHALLALIKKLKPKVLVCMGDVFDGATVSRWPNSYEDMPSVKEELEYCKLLLGKIEEAAPDDCNLVFCAGNHDSRFCTKLASHVPEFKGVPGFDLKNHFEAWRFCWSLVVNPNTEAETWFKHRYHQGVHAAYNNKIKAGSVHFVSAHTHQLEAKPVTDLKGRKWSVQTGTLSPIGPSTDKFNYAEDNPSHSCQGFVVLHYTEDGRKMLPPELAETIGEDVYWRGEKIPYKK